MPTNSSTPVITWDHAKKKLTGHYTPEAIKAVMEKFLQADELAFSRSKDFEITEAEFPRFTLSIARLLKLRPRNMTEVPAPIKHWCLRVLRIYAHKNLYEAWTKGMISTRYALDLADYVYTIKHRDIYEQAITGEITNSQFRRIKKERK